MSFNTKTANCSLKKKHTHVESEQVKSPVSVCVEIALAHSARWRNHAGRQRVAADARI